MVVRRAAALEAAGWVLVAVMGAVALTQVLGWTGLPVVYVAQALTPYLLTPAVPVAVIASSLGRHALAVVAALIAVSLLWLSMPVVFHPDPPAPAPGGVALTVAHANVYVDNPDPAAAAAVLAALDADIIAITEHTAPIGTALRRNGVETTHPFHLERTPGDRDGVALFSRFPFVDGEVVEVGTQSGIDATVDVRGTAVRVMVVHPLPGIDRPSLRSWRTDLPAIGDRASRDELPTVIVGDFNASRWHPAFRRLLGRGLTDAHEQLDEGFSVSWPTGKWATPTFVRLDHALVSDGLVATDIDDLAVPGSDHEGFVVTVATT